MIDKTQTNKQTNNSFLCNSQWLFKKSPAIDLYSICIPSTIVFANFNSSATHLWMLCQCEMSAYKMHQNFESHLKINKWV